MNPNNFNNIVSKNSTVVNPYPGNPLEENKIISQPYIHNVVVDSSRRNTTERYIYEEKIFYLEPYPFVFQSESDIISCRCPNHHFNVGDRIEISGVCSKQVILRNCLELVPETQFIKIRHENHGLSLYGIEDYSEMQYIQDNSYISLNEEVNLTLEIAQIQAKNYIANIPINELKRCFKIYLIYYKTNDKFVRDTNHYFIKTNSLCDNSEYTDHIVTIKFNHLYGIPIADLNQIVTITEIKDDCFSFYCQSQAIIETDRNFYNCLDIDEVDSKEIISNHYGGGSKCRIRMIKEECQCFPLESNFILKLDRTYSNVIQSRIISSFFPNRQRIITAKNNKLYWCNYNTGDDLYCIELDLEYYTDNSLAKTLMQKFSLYNIEVIIEINSSSTCFSFEYPIQLIFDQPNHMGEVLGCTYERTDFLTNITFYSSFINRPKHNFYYIVCNELSQYPVRNTGCVNNVIGIILKKNCYDYDINTFVPITQYYDTPVNDLRQLSIEIRDPDNQLVDFNRTNFMFVLELIEIYDRPYDTNINTRINAELRVNNL